ncbi:Pumilio-like 12, partial [Mucuna pruriens]
MAEFDNDHPYPFMKVQNPTVAINTSFSSPSRNLQDSFNCGEKSALEMQHLASRMEALNLSNPYGIHDYGTNHMHDTALNRMRVVGAAQATAQVQPLRPIERFLRSPGCENSVFSQSYHNLEPRCGRCVFMAKDPCGCHMLENEIDNATPQEMHNILKELSDHLHELMKHPFAHHVIEKLFQTRNISITQINAIIFLIVMDVQKLKDVCRDDQGSRVILKMLENVDSPYLIDIITEAMKCITHALMKNLHGGYVIHQFLKFFPPAIFNVVAKNFVDIASDQSGCFSIQKCMDEAELEAFAQLVNEIISNALVLTKHPYGNYVVQFLIKKKLWTINGMLISVLRNKYIELSKNKYASNVVEGLLEFSETEYAAVIVRELMNCSEFLNLLQHPYGNYVCQRALQCTKGSLHNILFNFILFHYEDLCCCPYGKRVLAFAKACKRVCGSNEDADIQDLRQISA